MRGTYRSPGPTTAALTLNLKVLLQWEENLPIFLDITILLN